jgi:hypothetical protein
VQRARTILLGLMVTVAMVSSLTLPGCSEDVQETALSDVQRRSFAFSNGAVFHTALANVPVTLSFTDNFGVFALASARGTAEGFSTFAPCVLTVGTSTYDVGTGPQANDVIRLELCDFDTSSDTLIVGNGTVTAVSAPGVPL